MNNKDLEFLKGIFPERSDDQLKEHFGGLFGSVRIGNDRTLRERNEELDQMKSAIKQLKDLQSSEAPGGWDGFYVRKICKDIPPHCQRYVGVHTDQSPDRFTKEMFDDVIELLEEYLAMSSIWWKNNSRIGGKDVNAHNLAEAIALIFDEIGEKISHGTKSADDSVKPSTKFGKVVKYAFEYHGITKSWINVQRAVSNNRKGPMQPS